MRRLETKRVEYLVRALREEEAPVLKEWEQQMKESDDRRLEEIRQRDADEQKKVWLEAQELRQILLEIKPFKDEWVKQNLSIRKVEWEQKKKERHERIKKVLKAKKIERAANRYREKELVGRSKMKGQL